MTAEQRNENDNNYCITRNLLALHCQHANIGYSKNTPGHYMYSIKRRIRRNWYNNYHCDIIRDNSEFSLYEF